MTPSTIRALARKLSGHDDPMSQFRSNEYLRHNARRLEHLASLRIPISGKSVLEVGAGIGDHSSYFLDRGCDVTITEARPENLEILRRRYPACDVRPLDMEKPTGLDGCRFDVVYCYGLLYHLSDPEAALKFISQHCSDLVLLETCVSFGDEDVPGVLPEDPSSPTQAYSGAGCRPTRKFIFRRLQSLFEHVYVPITQPNHEQFPLDWSRPEEHSEKLQRAVFVASRRTINNDLLVSELVDTQRRHE